MTAAERTVTREQLVTEINIVMADTERLLQSLAEGGEQQAAEACEKIARSLRSARSRLEGFEGDLQRKAGSVARRTRDYGRTHPWQTLGAAVGVGILAGWMLRRP